MSLRSLVRDLKKGGRRDRDASRAAAKKLGQIGDESVISDLREVSENHKDKETRKLAEESFKILKKKFSIPTKEETAPEGSESYEITEPIEVEIPSSDALLIVIEETQEGTIKRDGSPATDEDEDFKKVDARGILKVKNTGEVDRIWDIDIKIRDKGLTILKDNYHINVLDRAEEWEKSYDIKDLQESLPLKFKETIDTVGGEEPSTILVYGKLMDTKIIYEIKAEKKLNDIKFDKDLPDHFKDLSIKSSSNGKPEIKNDKLIWEIPTLTEGEIASLELTCNVTAEDSKPKRTGRARIKFSSKVEGAFSGMDVEGADGLVKNYSYVESDELDDQPDNWNCRLVLENPSEFPIELRDILIKRGEYVYISEEYEESDSIIISPKGSWSSKSFTLFSEEIPSFEKNVTFTVKPEIMYLANSDLDVLDTEMGLASLKANKSYSIEKINSYRKTPVLTAIAIENTGSLGFSSVTIKDVLPPKFSPSDSEDIKIYLGKKILKSSDFSVKYDSGATVTIPDDVETPPKDTEEFDDSKFPEQTMVIKIDKEIGPDQKVKIEYIPIAESPEPNRKFSGSAEILADLTEPGPPLNVFIDDWLSSNVIEVVHARKAITIGKTILPGAEPGLFEIELSFKNRGDEVLENIVIKDIIPEGFTLVDDAFKDLAEDESTPQGIVRTWTFETIEKDQQVSITYNLQGEGDEFHIGQAQQTIG